MLTSLSRIIHIMRLWRVAAVTLLVWVSSRTKYWEWLRVILNIYLAGGLGWWGWAMRQQHQHTPGRHRPHIAQWCSARVVTSPVSHSPRPNQLYEDDPPEPPHHRSPRNTPVPGHAFSGKMLPSYPCEQLMLHHHHHQAGCHGNTGETMALVWSYYTSIINYQTLLGFWVEQNCFTIYHWWWAFNCLLIFWFYDSTLL